ncbi:YjcZ family sporulation protein [Bacillus coahuilensis]|uniref:YjcZ family sporulation protein n=1 Tax=Bacillus coahuilensis TaxID=408580 RepID=UPI0009D72EC3|nr:YjcZ family sporulation protein [Bacillus coahuilensis]
MYHGADYCYYDQPTYAYPAYTGSNPNTFALIVVLFILLIIIGAVCYYPRPC